MKRLTPRPRRRSKTLRSIHDPRNLELLESLIDPRTPENVLFPELVSGDIETMVDWFVPSQRLTIMARNYVEFRQAPDSEFLRHAMSELNISEEQAVFLRTVLGELENSGHGEALAHIASFPLMAPKRVNLRHLLA